MHPQTASNNKATARARDGAGKREAEHETEPLERCPLCHKDGNQPNAETIAAIKESEAGGGKRFNTVEELFEDLEI